MIATGEATALLPTETTTPIRVFGTESIRETLDDLCLQQAVNSRLAPGVTDLVLNPDAHCGYGAPVGCVMVAQPGAAASCYSVNHGAGRVLGRRHAKRVLDQATVDRELDSNDILSNCRKYPIDEAPAAYKDFNEVLRSVKSAGLASEVARLKARFVIKDASKADD